MIHWKKTLQLLALMAMLFSPGLLWAAVGKVVIAKGEVFAIDSSQVQRPLQRRSDIFEGDTLVTGADGALQIRFQDNAILALREDSRLLISEYHARSSDDGSDRVLMDLLAGGFRTITGSIGKTDKDAYQVRTPNASIGIRGTHYEALLKQESLLLGVYNGGISVYNGAGRLELGQGNAFLFARVQPGSPPQGLLDPPQELNMPFSPATDEAGEAQPEDEPASQLNEGEEEDRTVEKASLAETVEATSILPETEDSDDSLTLTEPITLTATEDELLEEAIKLEGIVESPDKRLTLTQIGQLSQDPPRTGFVVVMDTGSGDGTGTGGTYSPVHFGYLADGDNGPILANFESESLNELDNGYKTPDNVLKGPDITPEPLASHVVGGDTVEWGIWNASPEDTAKLYMDPASADYQEEVASSYFFVEANAAKTADLVGERYFNLCYETCISANRAVVEAWGDLSVNFTDGSGFGSMGIQAANADDPMQYDNWTFNYSGQVQGAQFFSTLNDSTVEDANYVIHTVEGNVDGLFTGPATDLHFVGGFNAQSVDSSHQLNGVFIMKDETPQ